jgi:ribonuclease HI
VRSLVWRLYRHIRTMARRRLLYGHLEERAMELGRMVGPLTYVQVVLTLKLAHTFTVQSLALKGAEGRADRALAREIFFLLRHRLQEARGLRDRAPVLAWRHGEALSVSHWRGICDGSAKRGTSAIGVLAFDTEGVERIRIAVVVPARSAVEAELQACHRALEAMSLLGATEALLEVDALSVLSCLERKLPARHCLMQAEISALVARFRGVEVRLMPRATTAPADRLAATLSQH